MQNNNHALRRAICAQRRALSHEARSQAAHELCFRIASSAEFKRARHVAAYWPIGGEIDPRPLLDLARANGKHTYLPVLSPTRNNRIYFMPYSPGDRLKNSRFGIPQPHFKAKRARPGHRLDLVLVPLTACDQHGHRLGMGGGYYDRTFAFKHSARRSKPTLLGIGYAFQLVDDLPHQPWDVMLDGFASGEHVLRFAR